MIEQDYLMRKLLALFAAIRRSWEREQRYEEPAESADQLEQALASAVEFDSALLLSLAPESFASMVQVSGTDRRVVAFMLRSLALASRYRNEAGQPDTAALRLDQARSLAASYGLSEEDWAVDEEAFAQLFAEYDGKEAE